MKTDSKRILLVHPLGYSVDAAGRDISRIVNIMPPIGLASIAAYLEREQFTADIVDCYAHPDSDRKITDYLQQYQPAWIGFSCTTSSFLDAVRIAKLAKGVSPLIRTVFGGPHISALKGQLLSDYPEVDIAVIGEGEVTLHELLVNGFEQADSVVGLVRRNANARILRDNTVIFDGKIDSLRRFKDDVAEVKAGTECGIGIKNYNDIKTGDQLEIFENIEVAATL